MDPPLLTLVPLEIFLMILDAYNNLTDLHAFAQILHYTESDKIKGRFDYLETTTGCTSPLPRVCRLLRQHFHHYFRFRLRLYIKLPASRPTSAARHQDLLQRIIPRAFAENVKILYMNYDKVVFPMQLREVFPNLRCVELHCPALRMYGPGLRLEKMERVESLLERRRKCDPGSGGGEKRTRYTRRYRVVLVGRAGMFVLRGEERGSRRWSWAWRAYKEGKVVRIDWTATKEYEELRRRKRAGEKVELVYSDIGR